MKTTKISTAGACQTLRGAKEGLNIKRILWNDRNAHGYLSVSKTTPVIIIVLELLFLGLFRLAYTPNAKS